MKMKPLLAVFLLWSGAAFAQTEAILPAPQMQGGTGNLYMTAPNGDATLSFGGNFTTSGAYPLTFTIPAAANITFPAGSNTMATAGANSNITSLTGLTGASTISTGSLTATQSSAASFVAADLFKTAGQSYNAAFSGRDAMAISGNIYGTPGAAYNFAAITSTDSITSAYNVGEFFVRDTLQSGFTGSRFGIDSELYPTSVPGSFADYAFIALEGKVQPSVSMGGSYITTDGSSWGGLHLNFLSGSAAYYTEAFGEEEDIGIATGASAARKNAINIVLLAGDANRGYQEDAGISFNSQGSVSDSWTYGVEYGSPTQAWSFGTDSTLEGAVVQQTGTSSPTTSTNTALYGTNWQAVNFTTGGAAFSSPGHEIDPIGNFYGGAVNVTGAVQDETAGVSSVTVNAGGIFIAYPTLTISPPPISGTQATATVSAMVAAPNAPQISFGNAGTSCTNGGTVTPSGDTGTEPTYTVTATGGVATGLTLLTPGSITAMGSQPHSFTGASCSGLTATIGFAISTVAVGTAGNGYPVVPPPLVISNLPSNYKHDPSLVAVMSAPSYGNLALNPSGGTVQLGSGAFTANGTTSLALSNIGPSGAHATVQEWLTVKDAAGTVRYIPAF